MRSNDLFSYIYTKTHWHLLKYYYRRIITQFLFGSRSFVYTQYAYVKSIFEFSNNTHKKNTLFRFLIMRVVISRPKYRKRLLLHFFACGSSPIFILKHIDAHRETGQGRTASFCKTYDLRTVLKARL